jgi:hypothetical protein
VNYGVMMALLMVVLKEQRQPRLASSPVAQLDSAGELRWIVGSRVGIAGSAPRDGRSRRSSNRP